MRAGPVSRRWGETLVTERRRFHKSQRVVSEFMRGAGHTWHPQTVAEVEAGHRVVSVDEADTLSRLFSAWSREREAYETALGIGGR